MFFKPTGSKAVPIVKPPAEEAKGKTKDHKDRKDRPLSTSLPPVHDAAIQQAVKAITSLTIASKMVNQHSRPANTVRVPISNPVPIPVSVRGMNDKHNIPMVVSVTENQGNQSTPTDDDDQDDCEFGFNIYARPFIPEIYTVINTLPGRQLLTSPRSTIEIDNYMYKALGPATGFLPRPVPMRLFNTSSTFMGASSISRENYEEFFQFHIHQEIQAQRAENNTYARK